MGAWKRRVQSQKPVGVITRGKTARNRLRRLDHFVASYDPWLLRRQDEAFQDGLWVDLGYGAEPFTTLETSRRWRRAAPALRGLGVEIDPERVRRAEQLTADLVFDNSVMFRVGGFNLPLRAGESVRLIRAFNVLRQYPPEAVNEALADLAVGLPEGALLVEGTSDPPGRVWVANIWRRSDARGTEGPAQIPWHREALVFSTNFRNGFDPLLLQAVLPKDLIHEMNPGTPIYKFFADWKQAVRDSRPWSTWGLRQWFGESIRRLVNKGYSIDLRRRWLRQGYLVWRHPELTENC